MEMAVFRAIYTVKVSGEEIVSFTEGGPYEEDNDCQTLVRALRWSEGVEGGKWDGGLWRTLCGDRASVYYGEFLHDFWEYWYVDLYRMWEARYNPEGRRRRSEGRWRRDREVEVGEEDGKAFTLWA